MKEKRPYYIPEDQWIEDLSSYVYQVAHRYLPLYQWGFHESYRDRGLIIFDSAFCRLKLLSYWDADNASKGEYLVSIYYGRLHAPDKETFMKLEGVKYICWIEPSWDYALDFINHAFPQRQRPVRSKLMREFLQKKEYPNKIHMRLALEAEVWRHYTPELFYLFDLRRPELWEQYRAWLKEKYIAEGRNEEEDERQGLIPYYRVC